MPSVSRSVYLCQNSGVADHGTKDMKLKTDYLFALVAAALLCPTAAACGMHGGMFGSGAYGISWESYDSDKLDKLIESAYKKKDDTADDKTAATKKARPSFSNAASRAVDTAKSRAKVDSGDAPTSD